MFYLPAGEQITSIPLSRPRLGTLVLKMDACGMLYNQLVPGQIHCHNFVTDTMPRNSVES